jgi:hypothetical protein
LKVQQKYRILGTLLLFLTDARTYTLRVRVRHAEGMRACTHGATHRSDSVARSTPTAQQERPNKTFINNVLMHHPKSGIERINILKNIEKKLNALFLIDEKRGYSPTVYYSTTNLCTFCL